MLRSMRYRSCAVVLPLGDVESRRATADEAEVDFAGASVLHEGKTVMGGVKERKEKVFGRFAVSALI